MAVAGIIFSNLHDAEISELTSQRTMASIPFACRYRLIDFALSNMVNSGINDINVIAHYNYHSLMDHIGSGKDWDLARRSGGVKILPPYITAYANPTNTLYHSRLDALKSVNYSISNIRDDYVVLSDCNIICNIDLKDVVNDHIKNDADITVVVKKEHFTGNMSSKKVIYETDDNNKVTDIAINPPYVTGDHDTTLYMMVVTRKFLENSINNAIAHNYTDFDYDIIARNINRANIRVYRHDGFYAHISSFTEYFSCSMDVINNADLRNALFNIKNRPIYTKVRNSAPTRYSDSNTVKNSLIADGCIIEGTVENTIIFRGVKIGKNAVVKNSILFQDTIVGDNASLNCVVADKNSVIKAGRTLSGHETLPYYINKGRMI